MPRLRYIEPHEKSPEIAGLIAEAEAKGAPDPRIASIVTRSPAGLGWLRYWNSLLYEGQVPHKLKEMCRLYISVAHQCGYCSTVRSVKARAEGLTEDTVAELWSFEQSARFTPREKAALRYAKRFKEDDVANDAAYEDLKRHFSDEEIIELGMVCAQTLGVGMFAKSMGVVSWEEACELNPLLRDPLPAAAEHDAART
jgi:AhpD family alkylhydroperoxidase